MTILDIFLTILWCSLLALAIAIIWWFIYAVFWKAWFYPINKQIKTDERRLHVDKEYNRIDAKLERLEDEVEIIRAEYSDLAVKKNDTEREIERKQKLLKGYDDELKEFRKWKAEGAPKASTSEVNPDDEVKAEALASLDEKLEDESKASKPKKKIVKNRGK